MQINTPTSFARAMRLVLVLAILAWAAEAAFGQEERFVPSTLSGSGMATATLELRAEATIVGGDIKLKQISRWSDSDATAFQPIADLVIAKVGPSTAFRAITVKELKQTLTDAGVNIAVIRFAGTTQCTVTRSDVTTDERANLEDWISARSGNATTQPAKTLTVKPSVTPTANDARTAAALQPAHIDGIDPKSQDRNPYHTLRELLVADLAERLSLDPDVLQMHFNPVDDKVLSLSEPHFRFHVEGQRVRNLGNVSWEVTIVADGGASQKTSVNAIARAWQEQLLVRKPMAQKQTIRTEDLVDRRTLVDQMPDDPPMKREQVVGQLVNRDLKPGTVLTSRLVDAAPLAQTGDLITVTVEQGKVQITTAARAMEGGTFGQTIKVKNESTGSTYEVTLIAPKKGRMTGPTTEGTASVAN